MGRTLLGRGWPLLALLGLVLFPFGWLGQQWPPFGRIIDWVFATNREHAVGHAIMFAILGLALLAALPRLREQPGLYLGAMLAAGVGQELFQLLYKARPLVFDDFRDLAVDLTAALAVWLALRLWRHVAQRRLIGHPTRRP